jgi:poly-gamma-glutamate synthesis protein (capsule biosynthesis protein)
MPPRTGPLVRADLDLVLRAVRSARRNADVVVVLPHWGTQYTHAPEPVQRRVGRSLVRAGADLVVGGHPHWVQGIDAVDGVPVLHSLGNFVFDMDFMEQTMQGVVLQATFWGEELKAVRLVPYAMDPGTFSPRRVRGTRAADILQDVWSASTGPFARR